MTTLRRTHFTFLHTAVFAIPYSGIFKWMVVQTQRIIVVRQVERMLSAYISNWGHQRKQPAWQQRPLEARDFHRVDNNNNAINSTVITIIGPKSARF